MKTIKITLTLVLLIIGGIVTAQKTPVKTTVTNLGIEVNTLDEIKTLDWDELFYVFEENSPKDSIQVSILVRDLKLEGKNEVYINNMSMAVNGPSSSSNELKTKLANSTSRMVKILENILK